MTSILGRMATYSGTEIKWEDALASKVQHMPPVMTWETEAPVKTDANGWYPVAIPGLKAKDYQERGLQPVEIV